MDMYVHMFFGAGRAQLGLKSSHYLLLLVVMHRHYGASLREYSRPQNLIVLLLYYLEQATRRLLEVKIKS